MEHKALVFENILPASELELTPSERASLIEVRDIFVANAKAAQYYKADISGAEDGDLMNGHKFDGFGLFNMSHGLERADPKELKAYDETTPEYSCGTSACIAGWMKLQERGKIAEGNRTIVTAKQQDEIDSWVMDKQYNKTLASLFFPYNVKDWNKINLNHAIVAIDSFLYTGRADWSAAIKDIGRG